MIWLYTTLGFVFYFVFESFVFVFDFICILKLFFFWLFCDFVFLFLFATFWFCFCIFGLLSLFFIVFFCVFIAFNKLFQIGTLFGARLNQYKLRCSIRILLAPWLFCSKPEQNQTKKQFNFNVIVPVSISVTNFAVGDWLGFVLYVTVF